MRPIERLVIFAEAFLTLAAIRAGLVLMPYGRFRAWFDRARGWRFPHVNANRPTVIWAVAAAARRLPFSTCLPKALAAELLLAWRGVRSETRIGVAADDGKLRAHAWLEVDGEIVFGATQEDGFAPLRERTA